MTEDGLEREYTVEPQQVTDHISIAPTMKGGFAVAVDGEHIDHLDEGDITELLKYLKEAKKHVEIDDSSDSL